MITKFKLFLEAKLGNLATIIGNDEIINKVINSDFDDADFIPSIYLENYDKTIKVDWNHNENHNIKQKLKNRTQLYNISEFNTIFEKIINELFDLHFEDFNENIEKYDLYLTESNIHIIVIIDYKKLFQENTNIFILTILPQYPDNIHKIIEFNY